METKDINRIKDKAVHISDNKSINASIQYLCDEIGEDVLSSAVNDDSDSYATRDMVLSELKDAYDELEAGLEDMTGHTDSQVVDKIIRYQDKGIRDDPAQSVLKGIMDDDDDYDEVAGTFFHLEAVRDSLEDVQSDDILIRDITTMGIVDSSPIAKNDLVAIVDLIFDMD